MKKFKVYRENNLVLDKNGKPLILAENELQWFMNTKVDILDINNYSLEEIK